MTPQLRTGLLLLSLICAAGVLDGCGLKGRLDRPPPMWGNPQDEGPSDPRHVKERRDAAAASKAAKHQEQEEEEAQRRAEAAKEDAAASASGATSSAPPEPAPTNSSPIPNQR